MTAAVYASLSHDANACTCTYCKEIESKRMVIGLVKAPKILMPLAADVLAIMAAIKETSRVMLDLHTHKHFRRHAFC